MICQVFLYTSINSRVEYDKSGPPFMFAAIHYTLYAQRTLKTNNFQ